MPAADARASSIVNANFFLTRRFFLAGNEKIVITFSAGVAQLAHAESAQDAVNRADQAMYLAKRAGRNRVLLGVHHGS